METRTRAKSRYFIVTQLSIKNAPARILVKVGPDEGDDWQQFQDCNAECNINATYEEVGPVRSPSGAYRLFLDGIGKDNLEKLALSSLTHDQLVELALKSGVKAPVIEKQSSRDDCPECGKLPGECVNSCGQREVHPGTGMGGQSA